MTETPEENDSPDSTAMSAESLREALGFGANLDDPRHLIHYRFAFVVVPDYLFGPYGVDFLDFFLKGQAQTALRLLWRVMGPEHEVAEDAFEVDQRRTPSGDLQFVVRMPEVAAGQLEAHFFGIHIPNATATRFESRHSTLDDVRLVYLEESFLGMTVVGESRGPGQHFNLGAGPEATLEGMWLVMDEVFAHQSRPVQGGVHIDQSDD